MALHPLNVRDDEQYGMAFRALATEAAHALLAVTELLELRRQAVQDPDWFPQDELRIEGHKLADMLRFHCRRVVARCASKPPERPPTNDDAC